MDLSGFHQGGSGTLKPLQDRNDTLLNEEGFVGGVRQREREVVRTVPTSNRARLQRINNESASADVGPVQAMPGPPLPRTSERIVESLGAPAESSLATSRKVSVARRIEELRVLLYNAVEGSQEWRQLKQQIHNLEERQAQRLVDRRPLYKSPAKWKQPIDIDNKLPQQIAGQWIEKMSELAKEPKQNHSQKYSLPWRPPSPSSAARRFWTMNADPKDARYADMKVKYFESDLLGGVSAGRPDRRDMEYGFYMAFPK